jgi:hypothetical protein
VAADSGPSGVGQCSCAGYGCACGGCNRPQQLAGLAAIAERRSAAGAQIQDLAGLQLDDAEITFDDAAAQRITTLRMESLHTTAVAYGQPIE